MLTMVPLHQRPDLLEACADLINEEWKRSRTSRIHSLQRSTHNFPMCLVLIRTQRTVEETADGKVAKSQCQLLGHARLSLVVGQPKSLFVETVVVAKALRGKGYGRKLMEAVEKYAKSRDYKRLHLTTHDKQHFYAHLGYTLSKPVQCVGFMSSLVSMEFLETFSPPQHDKELSARSGKHHPSTASSSGSGSNLSPLPPSVSSFSSSVLPPPAAAAAALHPPFFDHSAPITISTPPQLEALSSHLKSVDAVLHTFTSSSQLLAADDFSATNLPPPPPPLPPPPPGPPPMALLPSQPASHKPDSSDPSGNKPQGQMCLETPYQDLKGRPVFWMEKDI